MPRDFNSGSFNFGDVVVFENSPTFMRRIAREFWRYQVRPEFECFDTGHIGNIKRMIEEGYFEPPYFFQLVMLPLLQLQAPATRVALPVLSRLQDSRDRFNAFIASPVDYMPGTAMGISGDQTINIVRDKVQRANLIAFLRQKSDDPPALPTVAGK